MGEDSRVDDYIAKAADFARPILEHLRAVAHRALPEAKEGIKWGMPHFLVNGKTTEAKTQATREKRMAQAVEWIAEGKHRHWKYERRCPVSPRPGRGVAQKFRLAFQGS